MNNEILNFLATPACLPFSVALAIMTMIAIVERLGALIGIGISGLLDGLFFELDADIDAAETQLSSSNWLGWLYVGKVPVLIILVLFLTFFGLSGLLIQSLSYYILSGTLSALLVSIPALLIAVICVRFNAGLLSRMIPKDDTEAVNSSSFIGRVAVITLGTARYNSPAQAKLSDQYGQTHYVMVEPDIVDDIFSSGTSVLIVKQEAAIFRVIKNTLKTLVDN